MKLPKTKFGPVFTGPTMIFRGPLPTRAQLANANKYLRKKYGPPTEEEIAKMKHRVTFIKIEMVVDGKRREMQFVRAEKIDELLGAKDTVGSFLRAFRDAEPSAPKAPPRSS